jgi:hypothetical protein
MVKAIVRAFRWRDMLENDEYATIREIAAAEKINETYVGRVLRLTLLAPDIVEAILGGRQPPALQLDRLLWRFPVGWKSNERTSLTEPQSFDPTNPALFDDAAARAVCSIAGIRL